MSKQAIHQYYNRLDQYKRFGGTRNESSIRRAFANLLEEYCVPRHLMLVDELHLKGSQKRPDGTVKNANQLDWGHWESKDAHDVLDDQILAKLDKGYPTFNILFENTIDIVLIQEGQERLRGKMADADVLDRILTAFVTYERPEIQAFREAIEKFRADIPDIVEKLRGMIAEQAVINPTFRKAHAEFWKLCQQSINPDISEFDIREMLIQHILTAEIFNTVFAEAYFHRENNVARELERVVNTFFTGALRRNTLAGVDSYYKAITTEASRITDHHEKQKFLKVVYENFYKAYNPKGADRLGIVYTPNEIVDFMIKSTDYLLEQHFGRTLADKNVEILDPATGTGTFITDIIEHIPPQYLEYKYKHEIHANEVAILPYYIANLNIEFTYQQKMGVYAPFENIVFVDTLDNLGFGVKGEQESLFGFSAENIARIKRQNERKISVIIGNPPYNANQMNENDNNKNREYFRDRKKKTGGVDGRIKDTYIKQSTAQKTKVYDMYSRFIRWASDRLPENGIIAFITNRSFINSRTFDGFRQCVRQEFDTIYVIDLNGDIRANTAQSPGNVFGIKTGVALIFLVRREQFDLHGNRVPKQPAIIRYASMFRFGTARGKLAYLAETKFNAIPFETIAPDHNANWIELGGQEFFALLPMADKASARNNQTLFALMTNGVVSNRDAWVYDLDKHNLGRKAAWFIQRYQTLLAEYLKRHPHERGEYVWDDSIKWSETLKAKFRKRKKIKFARSLICQSLFRPFTMRYYYAGKSLSDRLTANHYALFGKTLSSANTVILYSFGKRGAFSVLATSFLPNLDIFLPNATHCLGLYRYDADGNRIDNITDWGLQQFRAHYHTPNPLRIRSGNAISRSSSEVEMGEGRRGEVITKEDIFHYTYAVLHNPAYRRTYEMNLKRDFPRLPLYDDFFQWVAWGKALMDLHLNYATVEPYPLQLQEELIPKEKPKAKLRAIPENGTIMLDENTTLLGVPEIAWEYKLGKRSALHWILDQYKEKTPHDPTIAAQFNTYTFSDYKTHVIDLLRRVCTVSVKTMEIVQAMAAAQPAE